MFGVIGSVRVGDLVGRDRGSCCIRLWFYVVNVWFFSSVVCDYGLFGVCMKIGIVWVWCWLNRFDGRYCMIYRLLTPNIIQY